MDVLSISLLIILVSCIMVRSELVFKERDRIAEKIFKLGMEDIYSTYKKNIECIDKGGSAYLRYENLAYDKLMLEFYKVSYLEMVFKFWVPIKRFYRDLC